MFITLDISNPTYLQYSVQKDNVSDRLEGKTKMRRQGMVVSKKLNFKPLKRDDRVC